MSLLVSITAKVEQRFCARQGARAALCIDLRCTNVLFCFLRLLMGLKWVVFGRRWRGALRMVLVTLCFVFPLYVYINSLWYTIHCLIYILGLRWTAPSILGENDAEESSTKTWIFDRPLL